MSLHITGFVKKKLDPAMVEALKACQKAHVAVPEEILEALGIDEENDFDNFDQGFGPEIDIKRVLEEAYFYDADTIDIDLENLKKEYPDVHRIRCQIRY